MQLITGLLITSLFGTLLIAVLLAGHDHLYRNIALATPITAMILSFYMLSVFDTHSTGLQLTEHMKWNPRLGLTDIISHNRVFGLSGIHPDIHYSQAS